MPPLSVTFEEVWKEIVTGKKLAHAEALEHSLEAVIRDGRLQTPCASGGCRNIPRCDMLLDRLREPSSVVGRQVWDMRCDNFPEGVRFLLRATFLQSPLCV